jgi:hypothetical protein
MLKMKDERMDFEASIDKDADKKKSLKEEIIVL